MRVMDGWKKDESVCVCVKERKGEEKREREGVNEKTREK